METFYRFLQNESTFVTQAADEISGFIEEAVDARGVARVALAGGSTPKPIYEQLALRSLPWPHIRLFLGDERLVPPDAPESNAAMVRDSLLTPAGLAPNTLLHPVPQGMAEDPGRCVAHFENALTRALGPLDDPTASLDLVILGMGADGHTASLFPSAPALALRDRRVAHVPADDVSPGLAPRVDRLTLTLAAINDAHAVLFLVTGRSKLAHVRAIADGDAAELPAAMVAPRECLVWRLLESD